MATCTGKNTLDPFQAILDAANITMGGLERQARQILPFVDEFRALGLGFDDGNLSPAAQIDAALAAFTKEAICASETDLAPINQFVEDCLNDALRAVRRYLADLLANLGDGMSLIDELVALFEFALMFLLQKIWDLIQSIRRLISAIDGKLTCVTSLDDVGRYTGQVEAINDRVDTVTDDLFLDPDGSFNHQRMTFGFSSGLRTNIDKYYDRSVALQSEIQKAVNDTLELGDTVNPKNKF